MALARQRGIELARGELVAFTDIDCVADPLWLEALDQGLRSSSLGGIGGHVLSYSRRTYIERYCDYYGSLRTPVYRGGHVFFLIGANSCWRSEVLAEIGGLNAEYGCYAGSGVIVRGYEDFEMSLRVRSRGYQLGYAPSAIVYHQHRSTLRARLKQFYHYGGGCAFFHHICRDIDVVLGRYDLDYPPCFGRILRSTLQEALLLPIKPLDSRNRNLSLDRRVAYPLFDFLQRMSFYTGFCSMSRRLVALGRAGGGTGLPPEADHPPVDTVRRLSARE